MATTTYGMGQIRYSGGKSYMENLSFTASTIRVSMNSDDSTSGANYYQDIILKPNDNNFSFLVDSSYLLRLTIPKDENYDTVFRIKMIGTPNTSTISSNLSNYQILKYINLPKTNESANNSLIILYPVKSNGQPGMNNNGSYTTKVAIVKQLEDNPVNNDVVTIDGDYYIWKGSKNSSLLIGSKNTIILNHSWTSTKVTDTVTYDIVFSPRTIDQTFQSIWIELYRENYDQDIFDGTIYGRKIDKDSGYFDAQIYSLTDLIPEGIDSLSHIGVYGHPNLIMSINGEEIRIGQSGYYELNDFEINSLAIAANDEIDRFTIDYQYKQEDQSS